MTQEQVSDLGAVVACADLVGRCGAKSYEIGYVHDVPSEEAGWWASAEFQGAKILVEDHRSPSAAATALARRLLLNAGCRCGQTATTTPGADGCLWTLVGKKWLPGCRAEPVRVRGYRGDLAAMRSALVEVREAAKRGNTPRRGKWRRR